MARQSPFMSSAQFTYPAGYQQIDTRYAGNSSVESAVGLNRRPSLLAGYHNHFGSPERASIASYYPSLAPISMGPHVDEHSKRSRYPTGGNSSVNSQLLPLSIEVKKEQQVYQPQTEAISPTPDDPKNDSNIRDSTIIRNAISKVESEIDLTMKKLYRAKLSQSEIKSQADRSAADEDENDHRDDLLRTNGSQTLLEKVLHDNRKKAEDSQKLLNHLNNDMDLTIPLYHEPNDLESIQRIRIRYMNLMRNRLRDFFKQKHKTYHQQMKVESQKYDQIYREWQKTIEKEEKLISNQDSTTYRETFEKTFPEIRKTREDKEKKQSATTNDSATSEQTPSLNTLEPDLENEDEKLRKSSIVPPIIFDTWQRKHKYFNQNGLIRRDALEFYKERTTMPYWSSEEKQIFIEKFTQSPKNFGYISSFLENKTTEQCVQFYYMTKKTENYKNLLRKQSQANRRRAKQNATTTTTTITSSTTIETTLVAKVTSSNMIASSTSQQLLGQIPAAARQDAARLTIDRLENDEEPRDTNLGDGSEEKRSNKNRCQLFSCTTEKLGKKKNRRNRLRAFPTKWNELTKENREEIRRLLQIPPNVQRCCTRCYEKLILQVRQRQTTSQPMEEDDDDDEESSKTQPPRTDEQNSKHSDEWTQEEIDAFTEAFRRFRNDWPQIAEYLHRSEQSCRTFYQKYRQKLRPIDQGHIIDEDDRSMSGSEDASRRLIISIKSRANEPIDEDNDNDPQKTLINEDSHGSTHGLVIDEGNKPIAVIESRNGTTRTSLALTTISSFVEKEISKTLIETEKRSTMNIFSPEKLLTAGVIHPNSSTQPPPLVTISKSHSPPIHSLNQQTSLHKGSIMRGTPISPSNKPISIDTSNMNSRQHSSPRNDYAHLSPHIKSTKTLDQQHLYLQQQQQAAYMRHYSQQQGSHHSYPSPSSQYLQQQQQSSHKSSSINSQQQQVSNNSSKSIGVDTSNTDTYETLRADFVTSRYLTTTYSPNHERQSRHPSEQRSPSQASSSSSANHQLLPSPVVIHPSTSNPSLQSSASASSLYSHHSQQQQQPALLAASQIRASSGMYPQELLAGGILPFSHYYGSLPGTSYHPDQRLMHDFTSMTNNEQLKNLRPGNRHLSHASTHSPPDPSTYSSSSSQRHSHDNIEHMRYPTGDYATPIWRIQTSNNPQQQLHPQLKSNSGSSENPLLKLNELSRHSTRVTSASERDARSPDDIHHRVTQLRLPVESPSAHFQRAEAYNHHKSSSHEKLTSNLHFSDLPTDTNPSSYIRQSTNVHKLHASHHPTSATPTRSSLVPPLQISPHHAPSYMFHGLHHSPVGTISPQQHYSQQRSSHHNESARNSKEPISIQEFMKQKVNEFVALTNNEHKSQNSDLSLSETSASHSSRVPQPTTGFETRHIDNSDQPILLDSDNESNINREQNETHTDGSTKVRSHQDMNKSTMESDMPARRRDSSIKKILSNQPLEKAEYIEINKKVQSSNTNASKVHSTNDANGLERANSTGGRESTRSRGSITMRMLMGANGIYADGKAQPMAVNEVPSEQTNKRAPSPSDETQSLEYLIRGELFRACPTLPKHDETLVVFQNRTLPNRSSPITPQRSASGQPPTKRIRTSSKDDVGSNNEQRHPSYYSNYEAASNVRDPFVLQTHSKNSEHKTNQSSSLAAATVSSIDRNWQSYVQQQYQHSFGSRASRPTMANSGSITHGSPISPPTRLSTDQQQYPLTANNQLVNPRYCYNMNKNEQQSSSSKQPSTSLFDHSPKGTSVRRMQPTLPSPSDNPHELSSIHIDPISNQKSPPINPLSTNVSSNTPPMIASPVSSSASPTTSISSNSAQPLKKRLISEYELEQQQQRNSPLITSSVSPTPPPLSSKVDPINNSSPTSSAPEAVTNASEETKSST